MLCSSEVFEIDRERFEGLGLGKRSVGVGGVRGNIVGLGDGVIRHVIASRRISPSHSIKKYI